MITQKDGVIQINRDNANLLEVVTMRIRNRLFRRAVIILSTAALATQLSACGSESVKPNGAAAEETETPKLASELFAVGAKDALLEAVKKSERIGSAQLNLLLDPGAQLDNTQSNYTKSSVSLIDPQDAQGNLTLSMEAVLDGTTGDSSMVTSIQAGGEVAQSGGIYFTGNTMLIKKANSEKPMIQHTIDPVVAGSFKSLSAVERFVRVLSDTTKAKMSDDEWSTSVDTYLHSVTAGAQETNYVSEPQSVTLAGKAVDCTATTLTLTGEAAIAAARGMVTLISQDPSFKSYFVSQYLIDENNYGVTGMDAALRDLDGLTPEERSAMTLSFKTLQGENTSCVYLNAVTGAKSMTLLFKFYNNGNARQNDITFTGFDGGGITMTEQNSPAGGDNYTGQIVYDDIAPGGAPQEHMELATQSTITQASYMAKVQLKYNRAALTNMSAMDLSANLDYSQQKTAQGTSGTSTGTIVFTSEGEATTLNMSMTLEQSNIVPPVSVPQFIAGAGVSTADQTSLYAALGDDESLNSDTYNRAPATGRTLAALMLVFF